jgi:very-short-patch-repair endonuclease
MREVKKAFARQLRKGQTIEEKLVWELLQKRKFKGFKFRRQHVLGGFILDFYCHELRLGLEIDGPIHLRQNEQDQDRQEAIEAKGIKIIRITNEEVANNKRSILTKINRVIGTSTAPSPSGRGQLKKAVSPGELG